MTNTGTKVFDFLIVSFSFSYMHISLCNDINEISRKYDAEGLPEDTVKINLTGSAGQSLGAFCPKGMTFTVTGDTNDYLGKGLSGAKIVVRPSEDSPFIS